MDSRHQILDTSGIITPALIVFHEILEENIDRMVRMAGEPSRLRPHCKTHKMKEVVRLQLDRGVTKHKAATFPECEMLVEAGARDVLLAYPSVGANIGRVVKFVETVPDVAFSVIADHARPIAELGDAMAKAGRSATVLLDLDTGLHRTGIEIGRRMVEEDGAEVIIMGCASMAGYSEDLEHAIGVPVLDPVAVTFKVAEALTEIGVRHSKIGLYALPARAHRGD